MSEHTYWLLVAIATLPFSLLACEFFADRWDEQHHELIPFTPLILRVLLLTVIYMTAAQLLWVGATAL